MGFNLGLERAKNKIMSFFSNIKDFIKSRHEWIKQNSKRAFWIWVTYQAVKGTITLSFIWIPLFLMWLHHQ